MGICLSCSSSGLSSFRPAPPRKGLSLLSAIFLLSAQCRSMELPFPEKLLTSLNNSVFSTSTFLQVYLFTSRGFTFYWDLPLCVLAEIGKLLNQIN